MRRPKKHLSFGSLYRALTAVFESIADPRQAGKIAYSLRDALACGFAVMFFQDPSLLQFQRRMKSEHERCNLETIFGVQAIPPDRQLREIIDPIAPADIMPLFTEFIHRLQRAKQLESFIFMRDENGQPLYLVPMDGTQYYASDNIHCKQCLVKKHGNDRVSYAHQALLASIVNPDKRQVLPLLAEEICNRDGTKKQDCEINAAKRLLRKIRAEHPRLGLIIVGDGLYSKQPIIDLITMLRMHYILVAKHSDHPFLAEYLAEQERAGRILKKEVIDEKHRRHVYEWINDVPLFKFECAVRTNYFRYRIIVTDERGGEKVCYENTWITDLKITADNVETLVHGGRARWKIENECFNNLKNQGYHLEHSFGHGEQHLAFNFLLLMLLAFFFHQIFELTDRLFQECRAKRGSRHETWGFIRHCIGMILFNDWEQLLLCVVDPSRIECRINSA